MKEREDQLNGHFAQSDFKLDEGEILLKEMQQLRDELSQYEDEVQRLIETAGEIVPLRARRERLRQPIGESPLSTRALPTMSFPM